MVLVSKKIMNSLHLPTKARYRVGAHQLGKEYGVGPLLRVVTLSQDYGSTRLTITITCLVPHKLSSDIYATTYGSTAVIKSNKS